MTTGWGWCSTYHLSHHLEFISQQDVPVEDPCFLGTHLQVPPTTPIQSGRYNQQNSRRMAMPLSAVCQQTHCDLALQQWLWGNLLACCRRGLASGSGKQIRWISHFEVDSPAQPYSDDWSPHRDLDWTFIKRSWAEPPKEMPQTPTKHQDDTCCFQPAKFWSNVLHRDFGVKQLLLRR